MTPSMIRSLIESKMEPVDRAYRILEAFKAHDGKLLSKPLAAKVAALAGETKVYISRQYGMTAVEFGSGDDEMRFYLAHSETNVYIDSADIEKRNPCYLSAAKERNEARSQALADPTKLEALADAIARMNQAAKDYRELTGYGTVFYPDEISIRKTIDVPSN